MSQSIIVKCAACGSPVIARKSNRTGIYACVRVECKSKATQMRRVLAQSTQAEPTSVDAAIEEAEKSGKPLLLDIAILRGVRTLTVVHDPLDVGGFAPGQRFHRDEWLLMYGLMTFTHGTILRDKSGRLYRADGSVA